MMVYQLDIFALLLCIRRDDAKLFPGVVLETDVEKPRSRQSVEECDATDALRVLQKPAHKKEKTLYCLFNCCLLL